MKPRHPKPPYVVIAITRGGVTKSKTHVVAPSDTYVVEFALRHKARYVTRYFPSKRGWVLFDVTNAVGFAPPSAKYVSYNGVVRGERIYPTEDAVVMHAIALACKS